MSERNELIREWIDFAVGDFRSAERLLAFDDPEYRIVCFHAQQCVEKLMKALLIKSEVEPPKIHNLVMLKDLIIEAGAQCNLDDDKLRVLSAGAVELRYPSTRIDRIKATAALETCRLAMDELLPHFRNITP